MIANMAPSYTSPSFNARYLAAMSTDGRWRRFQAVDMHGRNFPVEVSFAITDDHEHGSLLVSLRRPTGPVAKDRFKAL